MAKTLYICYFGMREPLVQTQVLPYLREIQKEGIEISIVTFEPKRGEEDRKEFAEVHARLAEEGIDWHWLPYHKRFSALATAWDIFRGAWFVRQFISREKPDVLHGRVHVPTLMGALGRKFSRHKPKLLFDIRGFFPEEYTDAGIWPENGWLYRGAKRVERWLMKESDAFVVLTEKAREILFPESKESGRDRLGRPIEVIPCCVDFERRFSGDREKLRIATRRKLGIEGRFVIVHLGALGGLYLTKEIAELFAASKADDPQTFALFLTQSEPDLIRPLLEQRGFGPDDMFIQKVGPLEVEKYLAAADIALSFVKAGYATASRSPTKIPEYLASGLPIVFNSGVGDVDLMVETHHVGAKVDLFDAHAYSASLAEVRKITPATERLRRVAKSEFDLSSVGGHRYRRLYSSIIPNVPILPAVDNN